MKLFLVIGTIVWLFLAWNAPQQYADIKAQERHNEAERYQQLIKQNKILNP